MVELQKFESLGGALQKTETLRVELKIAPNFEGQSVIFPKKKIASISIIDKEKF
jgi:hypothetical protein